MRKVKDLPLHASALTCDITKEASDMDKVLAEISDVLEAGQDYGLMPPYLMTYVSHTQEAS